MAEVGLDRADAVAAESTEARERFLTWRMWALLVAVVLFTVSFARVTVHDDGIVYFNFVRKLFGADVAAQAYQFGSAFWTAPFYLVSQLVAVRGELDRYHAGELGTVVAACAAGIAALYVGWRLLRELELPHGAGLLAVVLFGTPLFFYATIEPAYKHAADALYSTAAALFLLLALRDPGRRRFLVAAGVCLGLMLATRYANVAMLVGVGVMFGWQRAWRPLAWLLCVTVVTAALAYSTPVVRGIPFESPSGTLASPADMPLPQRGALRLAAPGELTAAAVPGANSLDVDPRVPAWMLFTLHRGLFVWTPLTVLATVGFVLLLRRDRRHRPYLAGLGAAAIALLVIHAAWASHWDGGVSFSARFLTALFPFFLIGAAAFVRRAGPALGLTLLAACAVWSVWLGLVLLNGYDNQSVEDGVDTIVARYTGEERPRDFVWEIRDRVRDRWQELWAAF
jgi:hypothetical protein